MEKCRGHPENGRSFYFLEETIMGFLEWLGISPRDDPEIPKIEDNVRDSAEDRG